MTPDNLRADIAALHNICRFNGRVLRFYSVAEHTALGLDEMVLRGEPLREQRLFAVHDLPESQLGIGDVTRNVKRHIEIARYVVPREQAYLRGLSNMLGEDLGDALSNRTVKIYDRLMGVAEVYAVASDVEQDDPRDFVPDVHGHIADRIAFPEEYAQWNLWAHFDRLFPAFGLRKAS